MSYLRLALIVGGLLFVAGVFWTGVQYGDARTEAHYLDELNRSNEEVRQAVEDSYTGRIDELDRRQAEYAEQARQAQRKAEQRAAELEQTRRRLEDVYENDSDAREWRNTPIPDSVREAARQDGDGAGDDVRGAADTTGMRRPLPPRRRAPHEWAAPRELAGAA